ncbi:MAG: hypothetical protein CMH46_00555 [Muricauda sp.]|nr:hypothetical protein [Allomuricauda sp.]MAU14014.1 hypothetical protein [Allomuricauda sp.]
MDNLNIVVEIGKQSKLKESIGEYRPAISLIKPRINNSTFITTIIDLRNKNNNLKKQITERFDGTEPTILLIGDLFTRSPFVKHSLNVKEHSCHQAAKPIDPEKKNELKRLTRVYELVEENEPFIVFEIIRPSAVAQHVPWRATNVVAFGLEANYLIKLDQNNSLTPGKLRKLKKAVLELQTNYAFHTKHANQHVHALMRQYKLRNVGEIKHRILEAGRISIKSDNWLELCSFLLPKYSKYLVDKAGRIGECLNKLKTDNNFKPDIVLYEQFPDIWSIFPWKDQVRDTLQYWEDARIFNMIGWKERFDIYAQIFDARKLLYNSMLCTNNNFTESEAGRDLVHKEIIINLSNCVPGETTFNFAFMHEYNSEQEMIHFMQSCIENKKIKHVVKGYGFQSLRSKADIIVVPNIQLKRFAMTLARLGSNSSSDKFSIANVRVFDGNYINNNNFCFGGNNIEHIYLFAADLWPFQTLKEYFRGVNIRPPRGIILHYIGNNKMASFCAPRYGIKPLFNYLEGHTCQLLDEEASTDNAAYWFPEPKEVVLKSNHLAPNEHNIKDFDLFLKENILDPDVFEVKDRLCAWNSYVFIAFDEANKVEFLKELSISSRFPSDIYQYRVNDRVITPDGFITQISRISNRGKNVQHAYKDNYEDFLLFLKTPFPGIATLQYHPTEVTDALVMKFQSITAPIPKVIVYGRWPDHAFEELRNMVYTEIAMHPTFRTESWNQINQPFPRKTCYGGILRKQNIARAQLEAEQQAEQEQLCQQQKQDRKRKAFAMAKQKDRDKNKQRLERRNEVSSVSSEKVQAVQENETPDTL